MDVIIAIVFGFLTGFGMVAGVYFAFYYCVTVPERHRQKEIQVVQAKVRARKRAEKAEQRKKKNDVKVRNESIRSQYYWKIGEDLTVFVKEKHLENAYRIDVYPQYTEFFLSDKTVKYVYAEHGFKHGLWDGKSPLVFDDVNLDRSDLQRNLPARYKSL